MVELVIDELRKDGVVSDDKYGKMLTTRLDDIADMVAEKFNDNNT